jgi:signal transduction histidine kinase
VQGLFTQQCEFKQIDLISNVETAMPLRIHSDQRRIKQVLMNLMSNALKFTQRGQITVNANIVDKEPEPEDTQIQTGRERCKKRLRLEIEDTGIGIKSKDLTKLFKYFGKLEDNQGLNTKGTGLGLNICKRIVEAMSGKIKIESVIGQGTKFIIFLPIVLDPLEQL